MSLASAKLTITGQVQGVGYRWFVMKRAMTHNVSGWTRNNSDGSVSVLVEGDRELIEAFINDLRKGPPMADVRNVNISWQEYSGHYAGFDIKH